jgi:hypothetical protein
VSTQPLTEMSTRSTSLGVQAAGASSWQLYHLHVPIVFKSGSLNFLEPSGPVQTCNGFAWPLRVQKVSDIYLAEHVSYQADNTDVPPAVHSNDNHVLWHNWSVVNRYSRPATESHGSVAVLLYFAIGLQRVLLPWKYESTSRQWDKHCFRKIMYLWATVIDLSVYFVFIYCSLTWNEHRGKDKQEKTFEVYYIENILNKRSEKLCFTSF